MKIAVVGRGNVGGGLADFWEQAGHEVTRIGRKGGDVSEADVVLFAVPGGAIADAVENVQGLEGKTAIDATNRIGVEPPSGFHSNAEFVKSKTNGPTAKSFNLNFARLYDKLGEAKTKPSNIWAGDEEAREVVEQLNRDAGYEPVYAGGSTRPRPSNRASRCSSRSRRPAASSSTGWRHRTSSSGSRPQRGPRVPSQASPAGGALAGRAGRRDCVDPASPRPCPTRDARRSRGALPLPQGDQSRGRADRAAAPWAEA